MNKFIKMFIMFFTLAFSKNLRIMGGEDADIREFPFVASLRRIDQKRYFCSGVIISEKHILTAAHCVSYIHKSKYKVFLGSDNITNFETINYNVKYVRIHPNFMDKFYNHWVLFNDIAVLTVLK
jgi:secreted trypsin-like serine protease